jgi:hypothetical protein
MFGAVTSRATATRSYEETPDARPREEAVPVVTLDDRITAIAQAKPSRGKEWAPPAVGDFADGVVLSFDPSLTNTAWVTIESLPGEPPCVVASGMCRPETTDLRGDLCTLWRAARLGEQLDEMIPQRHVHRSLDIVAHEMPVTTGHRMESSLMATREVRRAAARYAPWCALVPVYVAHIGAVLLSPEERKLKGPARKRATRAAVQRYVRMRLPKGAPMNEHVFDAAAVALTCLYDEAHR